MLEITKNQHFSTVNQRINDEVNKATLNIFIYPYIIIINRAGNHNDIISLRRYTLSLQQTRRAVSDNRTRT